MLLAYAFAGLLMMGVTMVLHAKEKKVYAAAVQALRSNKLVEGKQMLEQATELAFVGNVLLVALVLWLVGVFGLLQGGVR